MAVRKRFINPFAGKESVKGQSPANSTDVETPVDSKHPLEKSHETDISSPDEVIDKKAQSGTQKAQASTQVWTRKTLIAAYVM